ncbi:C5a anaphylatoxin chemotactic receptor 1 [Dissostichus eleginoides]|uniref:C5a anaphylatoxin chemotactic receptor 1 n=1 Tax=Dissostichus eleginoides TaxID=100907 RepID=A0AAD9CED9_DISEL|nr:C5a anaphylatoxin chemotactic receptor 1 [Dissostichus eleginoides]
MASPFEDYESISNFSDSYEFNYTLPVFSDSPTPEMQPIQIASLVFYGLVVLLGSPGTLWWSGVLQLVLISVDRWMLVSRPVWCQNKRRPKQAALGCVAVWVLALIGSIPQFVYTKQIEAGEEKRECVTVYSHLSARLVISYRFLVGFLLPFLVIVACHLVVYSRAESGVSRGRTRSKRTLRVIVVVVLSFFLCWLPLHILDFMVLLTPRNSPHSPKLYLAQVLSLCLAYFNSCLNPLLYVCLGRGFKDSMNRSLRNVLHFISEEPASRVSITNNDTKSSSYAKDTTKI